MLKTLIKKQFREIFRNYYVNSKTGKARNQKTVTWMIIGYGLLMGGLAVFFFFMDMGLCLPLIKSGRGWLYFSLNALGSIAFGTFGSVFATFSSLYIAKDNEMLLSLPIPPRSILFARLVSVFVMSALYSGVMWVPSVICYCVLGGGVAALIMGLILTIFVALFVTAVTAILGWIVAAISVRLKGKSFVTVILAMIAFGVYYFFILRSSNLISSIVESGDAMKPGLMTWGFVIYQLAIGACGEFSGFAIFAGITLLLFGVTMYVLSRSFIRIVTTKHGGSKAVYKEKEGRLRSLRQALFWRELKRYTSSAGYMLNTGFGLVMEVALGVLALIFQSKVRLAANAYFQSIPTVKSMIGPLGLAAFIFFVGMTYISTPSVSLEGDKIWVVQTLPVKASEVLSAKLRLHVVLNAVPAVFLSAVLIYVLEMELLDGILMVLCVLALIALTGAFGLFLGLKNPNLHWTNELQPIKQGMSALIMVFGTMILAVAVGGLYFLLMTVSLDGKIYLAIWLVIFAALFLLLRKWLETRGAEIFEDLS